jgi:hypothetical protein
MTLPTAADEGSPAELVSGADLPDPSLRDDEAGGYFRIADERLNTSVSQRIPF